MKRKAKQPAKPKQEKPTDKPQEQTETMLELPLRNISQHLSNRSKRNKTSNTCEFIGEPFPSDIAKSRWPHRYAKGKEDVKFDENGEVIREAKGHYQTALVDGNVINLNDDCFIEAGKDKEGNVLLDYIARIVEFFVTTDNEPYLSARWFYRSEDTVIGEKYRTLVDERRVFLSDVMNDNPLGCVVRRVKIAELPTDITPDERVQRMGDAELYCDMTYSLPFLTFANLLKGPQEGEVSIDTNSTISSESGSNALDDVCSGGKSVAPQESKLEVTLLDLYSGCGAMSTGLCLGASRSGIKLVNRWAVDLNSSACESLQKNHPETTVRNEEAEDFLSLLKEWAELCKLYLSPDYLPPEEEEESEESEEESLDEGEFEVEKLLEIRYGNPYYPEKRGVHFKVRWKGYDEDEDTWEPIEQLSSSAERLREFVVEGHRLKILPLPGDVDIISGGPPCQGVSGHNRYRKGDDVKNHQVVVFMDIIEFLKPKYVLMENVVDILKYEKGLYGRFAVGRLVGMGFQTRMGILAAGSYGVPQFRLRVFLWGALCSQTLPQLPLPTHKVKPTYHVPVEFEKIYVTSNQEGSSTLDPELTLRDAISDLPEVTNFELLDEREYEKPPCSDFQRYIRMSRREMVPFGNSDEIEFRYALYDHKPLQVNDDDYERVCQIPKKKGANFTDLPGVVVHPKTKKASLDPSVPASLVQSGRQLVPNYALKYRRGTSKKPFGRLWWDEIVSTVVTRAEPHNQAIIHPEQDRVLTVRENARLQGFLDCYRLYGSVKDRYMQVGNAVAVPVALALGYSFGRAIQGLAEDEPLMQLPFKFPKCLAQDN